MQGYEGWQKSTFSGGGDGANCLEVAVGGPRGLALRESEVPLGILDASPATFAGLIRHVKGGSPSRRV